MLLFKSDQQVKIYVKKKTKNKIILMTFIGIVSSIAEQEQDAMMERLRKERELRKKKEEEDSLTLEQTNEQVGCK